MAKVLVVDDEENIRKTLREILTDESYDVVCAGDAASALTAVADEQPDVILLDLQLPGKDGLELLGEIKAKNINTEVIIITGHGTIESAITAIKIGAYHFLQKPLSMIEVKQNVAHALQIKMQRDELTIWRSSEERRYQMIGKSPATEKIRAEILKVAPTNGRILITGPSGCGKEVVAYWIHKYSQRASEPFVKLNCAAIPANLIESELFGHERGAFTGAVTQKKGKFEAADKGTFFLDEIGDMDLSTQTKVLRVIQEGEFERVGGIKPIKVDVRIVAATHRDLSLMIAEHKFREDLFYRLNVVPIEVPPLAKRIQDIPDLANYFLENYCKENGIAAKNFTPDALTLLGSTGYPGNIRELRNIVERLAIMSDSNSLDSGFIRSIVGAQQTQNESFFTIPRTLADAKFELEKIYVKTQLDLNSGDIGATAEILGLHRTNLHRKMTQLGIRESMGL